LTKFSHILTVFLWIFSASSVFAGNFVLVIDPGHGGKDTGALGRKGKEKDINLAVSTLVGQTIAKEHPDVKVVYTRTKDVFIGLDERANIANKANANLFISIHANAVSRGAQVKGAEVYTFGVARNAENLEVAKRENSVILLEDDYEQKYEGFDPNSAESYIIFEFMMNLYADQSINFASMVQRELVKTANRGDRGVKQAGYLVLRKSTMPRILIELDFLSNSDAETYMLSQAGQKSLARSICNAFTKYKKEFDHLDKNQSDESPAVAKQADIQADNKQPTESQKQLSEQKEANEKSATSGKIYKIQILASTKKLTDKSPELKGYKADCFVEGIYYKYTCGESTNWNEIDNLRKKIAKDFKDAFIVTFENGVKIPNK